jgi:DNA invertase Pin-like site-specific DNA recombinase
MFRFVQILFDNPAHARTLPPDMSNNTVNTVVTYARVSTIHQLSENSHSLDAQKFITEKYAASIGATILAANVEQESGKNNSRPELQKALALCKKTGSKLVISRIDRLSRNASFLLQLMDSKVEFVACDMPQANKLTISLMAVIAQNEREMISVRVKEGLAAAKAKGIKLGTPKPAKAVAAMIVARHQQKKDFARRMKPIIEEIRTVGKCSNPTQIAAVLNVRGIKTATGGSSWWPNTVKNLLQAA